MCGCYVRLSLRIEPETKEIAEARFLTNGCGFMLAAADVLAEAITGKRLTELHGSLDDEIAKLIEQELGRFPNWRAHCLQTAVEALHSAFADFRDRTLREFTGEKALICTCFGVSEETVENCIRENRLESVEDVARLCKAGSGCGSCQMLIQELIDANEEAGI